MMALAGKITIFFWILFVFTAIAAILLLYTSEVTLEDCTCIEGDTWCCISTIDEVCPTEQCLCTRNLTYGMPNTYSWLSASCRDRSIDTLSIGADFAIALGAIAIFSLITVLSIICFKCVIYILKIRNNKSSVRNEILTLYNIERQYCDKNSSNRKIVRVIEEEDNDYERMSCIDLEKDTGAIIPRYIDQMDQYSSSNMNNKQDTQASSSTKSVILSENQDLSDMNI